MPNWSDATAPALPTCRSRPEPGLAPRAEAEGGPLCFVGDLHGRADLLAGLFAEIGNRAPAGRAEVVFLGDLIDRGPDSARVLAEVHRFCQAAPQHRHCLMGNHERMLLDMLAEPQKAAPRWLRVGGLETLASFGILPRHSRDAEGENLRLAAELRAALGPELLDWLETRPLFWRGAGLQAAHAGSDPGRPLAEQGAAELLWGRRPDPACGPTTGIEVQGHIIVAQAHLAQNRLWLDTGAFRTGRLSALWIGTAAVEWIEITGIGS